jgi:hypothetical protein
LAFPERVYTQDEVNQARELIQKGYKHVLAVRGSRQFEKKMEQVIELIKTADYYEFLRTYIRKIVEMEGFSQLHETDAEIWANMSTLTDLVNAASYIVQKTQQMKNYLEGKLYYGTGEVEAIEKRLEFIKMLQAKSKSEYVRKRCEKLLKDWDETRMQFP